MNITDFQSGEIPTRWDEIVRAIFARQTELMAKYKEIEQLPDPPLALHHRHGQRILKDFAWRTVEELTESYEAWEKHEEDRNVAEMHALEELADAVHFYVELLIFAGITSEMCLKVLPQYPFVMSDRFMIVHFDGEYYWNTTYRIGIAMNFLRNKAWKQSHVPTDEGRFREAALKGFDALINLWAALGYDQTTLFTYYFKKSEVNKFRQRSNY